jgi:hypothetical protein
MYDISQKDMANRTSVYVENTGDVIPRHIDRIAFRTMNPEAMAEFYSYVFELAPKNKTEGDKNYYLTDGHVTLVIMPWNIEDYMGTGIITAGMDHIGFKVENLEQFKTDLQELAANNPRLSPASFSGSEGQALLELFKRSCPLGQYQTADCDGILIDVAA